MPNLTDVLNAEDEPTVEEIAQQVCLPLDGSKPMEGDLPIPLNTYVTYTYTQTGSSGTKWIETAGTWYEHAIYGTGMVWEYNSSVKMEVRPDAEKFSVTADGLEWAGEPIIGSIPITGAGYIKNIMTLTQAQYDAIPTPDPETLYVVTG